jgi:hypothetical protein
MAHVFKAGDAALLLPARGSSSRMAGRCTVLMVLPRESTTQLYRVKNPEEPHERIVSENDLLPFVELAPAS